MDTNSVNRWKPEKNTRCSINWKSYHNILCHL